MIFGKATDTKNTSSTASTQKDGPKEASGDLDTSKNYIKRAPAIAAKRGHLTGWAAANGKTCMRWAVSDGVPEVQSVTSGANPGLRQSPALFGGGHRILRHFGNRRGHGWQHRAAHVLWEFKKSHEISVYT